MASFASCHRYHVIVIVWMVGDLGCGVMMVRSSSMASLITVAVSSSCSLAVLMVDTNSSGALVALSAAAAAGN